MQEHADHDWPGKADGVPRPPTPAELDDISSQQGMITDEWAPAPAPSGKRVGNAPPPTPSD